MSAWINAFVPTFGLIALGAYLRARALPEPALWAGLESLTFRVLLPALLASSISRVDLAGLPIGALAGTIWTAVVIATALALGLARLLGLARPAMTSCLQGGIRFNNYMALAISIGVFGGENLSLAGVVAGLIVPFVQTTLTLVFVLSESRRLSPGGLAIAIGLNPLMLGCLVGFAFALAGGMPAGLAPLVGSLGQAALAVGLLCVGAALRLASLRQETRTQLAVGVLKLVVVPALTLATARLYGLDHVSTGLAVMAMAMPTATTSYVQARAMGGDAELMAAIITLQHLAAVLTLPIWAVVLR